MTADTSGPAASCLRCGYDLRMVGADGVCPECGLAASASRGERERLEECPPGWVKRVAIGAGVLAMSAVLLAVPAGEGMLQNVPIMRSPWGYGGTMSLRNIAAWSFWDFVRMGGWVLVLYGAGLILQGVGVWLVTGREPGGVRTRAGWTRTWRILTLVAIAGLGFDLCFGPAAAKWMWSRRDWWLSSGAIVGQAAYVACPAIGLWHLRWLTVRMGRPKLSEYAAIVGAGLSGMLLLFMTRGIHETGVYALYHQQGLLNWWVVQNMTAILLLGPAMGIGAAYAVRRIQEAKPYAGGYAWTAGIWLLAVGWAVETETRNYTHRLWTTALALGMPLAVGVTFYLWAVMVLGRTAWTLWKAAREAEEAWRRADAAAEGKNAG